MIIFNLFISLLMNIKKSKEMDRVKKMPLICPACQAPLKVNRMYCACCETEVSGSYELPLLARLPAEYQEFVLEFVKMSGSLKEMAKQRGVSYPTVRNYLDDIIKHIKKTEEQ